MLSISHVSLCFRVNERFGETKINAVNQVLLHLDCSTNQEVLWFDISAVKNIAKSFLMKKIST